MRRQIVRRIGTVVAVLVSLVLAHDVVFLVRYGSVYGEELAHTGHGAAWTWAVGGSLGIGAGLLVAVVVGLLRLHGQARRLGAGSAPDEPGWRRLVRSWAGATVRLVALTVVLLTVQENVERMAIGLPGPNLGLLLSPDYPWALAIVGAISAGVAFVVALLRWRHEVLVTRIRVAGRPSARRALAHRPVPASEHRPQRLLGGRLAVRAPPVPLVILPA